MSVAGPPTDRPGPIAATERLVTLDVVRGLAVLGILAVNAMTFFWPISVWSHPPLQPDWTADAIRGWQIEDVFFRDKMRTLFSMLFGVSIFLVGGKASDGGGSGVLRSRLVWLAIFGAIHGAAFWFGDILLLYAVTGLGLMFVRAWSGPRLLTVGGITYLVLTAVYVGMFAAMTFMPPEDLQRQIAAQSAGSTPDQIAAGIAAMRGDAWSVTVHQFHTWLSVLPYSTLAMVPITASLMMIGMGLYKAGFFADHTRIWVYVLAVAVGAGCLGLIWLETSAILAGGFPYVLTAMRPFASFLVPLVSLGYAAGAILLLRVGLKWLLVPVIAVGRMAFTNYLTQTLIMTTLAYGGRGLGWYGQIGWPEMWGIIVVVWILQLLWSPMWLTFFRMGPFEWVWRCLTYRRLLPLRRTSLA